MGFVEKYGLTLDLTDDDDDNYQTIFICQWNVNVQIKCINVIKLTNPTSRVELIYYLAKQLVFWGQR